MKKIVSALLATLLLVAAVLCMFTAMDVETDALGDVLLIYETQDEIVIDGKLDLSYNIVSTSDSKTDTNWIYNPELTVDGKTSLYACWDKTYLYLFVTVPCNEEHSSYMDNASEHYIFNGHHAMWAVLPDNPYQDIYTGDNDDGTWTWGALYNANLMYEFTTICDSRTGDTVTTDHFKNMTQLEGFQCVCTADGKNDTYELAIPLAKVINSKSPNGIVAEEGSMFGFGFRLGLIDHGTGYGSSDDPDYNQCVEYSSYFVGDKYPNGLAYAKLASGSAKQDPKKIRKTYEIFPQASGSWESVDNGGATCTVKLSGDIATISGSTSGTWPSAYVEYSASLLVKPSAYLVYDFTVENGNFSIRFNDEDELCSLISDNLESGSGDLLPGHYEGEISFADIISKYGKNDDGYYQIDKLTVYSVDGATITVNKMNIEPDYTPAEESSEEPVESSDEVAESSEEVDETSEEVAESSEEVASSEEPVESTEETTDTSVTDETSEEAAESSEAPASTGSFPGWLIAVIAVVVVAVIAVVAVVLGKKKK